MAVRPLNADDIFISYTRLDAGTYANGLAAELDNRKFSCFIDALGTEPGADLPDSLKRRIRNSQMLVVVCTERSAQRDTIRKEIAEFLKTGRKQNIVPVDINGSFYNASWFKLVEGVNPVVEDNPLALDNGTPSPKVVERIDKQFTFRRGDERRQLVQRRAIGFLLILVGLIVIAGAAAGYLFWLANDQRKKADTATATATKAQQEADDALKQASAAKGQAGAALVDAAFATVNAATQKQLAEAATKEAAEKTKLAAEKTKLAADAEALRVAEQARADREQTIAEARSDANRSQALLRQRPGELPRILSRARESMEKAHSVKVRMVEADTALRDSLALLPDIQSAKSYGGDVEIALSPDGLHYATLSPTNVLRIYQPGNPPLLKKKFDCGECSMIALSSGLTYAAALSGGSVKIFDLSDNARHHTVMLEEGLSIKKIALSPGGRFLALVFDVGELSKMRVLEAASGKQVRSFDDLNMLINDMSFGPGGNLAVGGTQKNSRGESTGLVVIWSLPLKTSSGTPEPELPDASFSAPKIIAHDSEVNAIAPDSDGTHFATDRGIWKRVTGRDSYEVFARLPDHKGEGTSTIKGLALNPDGGSLMLVRNRAPKGNETLDEENRLEVWDAMGHRDVAHALHLAEIAHVGFKPDGQSVATTTTTKDLGKGQIRAFQTVSGVEEKNAAAGPGAADGKVLHVSPDGGYIVTEGKNAVEVWDVWGKKEKTAVPFGVLKSVDVAALSPGGEFLALSGLSKDGPETITVCRRDGVSYGECKSLSQNSTPLTMSLSANGQRLAVLYRYDIGFVQVIDISGKTESYITPKTLSYSNEVETESYGSIPDVKLISLSPNGRYLTTTDRGNLTQLFDLSDERGVELLDDTTVESVAFSADSSYVALGSDEGIVHVFETRRPEGEKDGAEGKKDRVNVEVARLLHDGKVTAIAFSEGSKYVATASSGPDARSHPLRVWLFEPRDLIDKANSRLDKLNELAPYLR